MFRFPKTRSNKAELDVPSLFDATLEKTEEEQVGTINGQVPRSILEWRVAKALWKLKLEFYYQYPLLGGTALRGGYVVDFLIFSAPNNIPLEVQGERWHTSYFSPDENMRKAIIESILNTEMRYVYENELQTQQDADIAVKKAVL